MIDRGDGIRLAAIRTAGRQPTAVFLPGFGSAMTGEKISALSALAAGHGVATLRLDYSGHGASAGRFAAGSVGRWRDDALALIDGHTTGPLVLFGSSMGGWIALLVALARPGRVAGILGVAAAPDFTERRIWRRLPAADQVRVMRDGVIHVATGFPAAVPITRTLIEDGRANALLSGDGRLEIACPVRLVHGQRDDAVDWRTAGEIAERIGGDVRVILVPDGDHRLSRPADIALLGGVLLPLLGVEDRP